MYGSYLEGEAADLENLVQEAGALPTLASGAVSAVGSGISALTGIQLPSLKDMGVLLIGIAIFLIGGLMIVFSFGDDLVDTIDNASKIAAKFAETVPVE